MPKQNTTLFSNIIYSFVTLILPVLVSLLLIPALIKQLGPERFGVLSLAWVFLGYFSLFNFGVGRATTKYVSEYLAEKREKEIPSLVKTSWFMLFVLGFLGGILLSISTPYLITNILKIPLDLYQETKEVFFAVSISIPLVIYTVGIKAVLEGFGKFRTIALIGVPAGILNYLLPFLVAFFITNRINIVVWTLLINRLVFLGIYLIVAFRLVPALKNNPGIDRSLVKPLLRFGGWLTISNIVGPLMTYLDRFLVGSFLSISAVTFYVTPYEMANRLRFIPASVMAVLFPAFSGLNASNVNEAATLFHKALRYLWLIAIPIMITLTVLAQDIMTVWIDADFAQKSSSVLQLLAMGWLVNYGAQVAYNYIQSYGYAKITAVFHLLELPFYLVAIWIFAREFGIVGVAFAWVLRVFLDAFLLFGYAFKLLPKNQRNYKYIFQLGGLALGLFAALQYLVYVNNNLLIRLVEVGFAVLAYSVVAWFGLVHSEEKENIRLHFRRLYAPN